MQSRPSSLAEPVKERGIAVAVLLRLAEISQQLVRCSIWFAFVLPAANMNPSEFCRSLDGFFFDFPLRGQHELTDHSAVMLD